MSDAIRGQNSRQLDEMRTLNDRHQKRKDELLEQQSRELQSLTKNFNNKRQFVQERGNKSLEYTQRKVDRDQALFSQEAQRLKERHNEELRRLETDFNQRHDELNQRTQNSLKAQNEVSQKNIAQARKEESERVNDIRSKGRNAYAEEIQRSDQKINETRKDYQKKTDTLVAKQALQQEKLLKENSQELQQLQTQSEKETQFIKQKTEADLDQIDAEYETELKETDEEYKMQMAEKNSYYRGKLEEQDMQFKKMLDNQKNEFNIRYSQNQQANEAALKHQKAMLTQELMDQKRNFVKRFGDPEAEVSSNFKQFSPNITEHENTFVIDVALPDKEKNNINVIIRDNKLILSRQKNFKDEVDTQDGKKLTMASNESFREVVPFSQPVLERGILKEETDQGLRLTVPKLILKGRV